MKAWQTKRESEGGEAVKDTVDTLFFILINGAFNQESYRVFSASGSCLPNKEDVSFFYACAGALKT